MAVSIKKHVDVESRALMKSADGSAYDKLLDGILKNPKFQSAVLSASSGLSDSTKESLADYGSAETIGDALETIATAALSPMVAATHSQLLQMATNGQLMPGCQYRITDYVATTNGSMNSQSANHPFDLVVVADTEYSINEVARAIPHEGDTYFANCNLAAWRIQYSLANDTSRFDWADATNGKGVIYRLIDEFGNDCPYDFKGIQFQRWAITGITSTKLTAEALSNYTNQFVYSSNGEKCYAYQNSNISVNGTVMTVGSSKSAYYYTFDSGSGADYSLSGFSENVYVYGNTIGECLESSKAKLNNIVFFGDNCNSNTFGNNCYSNTFGYGCHSNTFGNGCYSNTFGNYCNSNTFGNLCYLIRFGNSSDVRSYYRYITVQSGNQHIYLDATNANEAAYYQNVEIKSGVNNTTPYKPITDNAVNQKHTTTYCASGSKSVEV